MTLKILPALAMMLLLSACADSNTQTFADAINVSNVSGRNVNQQLTIYSFSVSNRDSHSVEGSLNIEVDDQKKQPVGFYNGYVPSLAVGKSSTVKINNGSNGGVTYHYTLTHINAQAPSASGIGLINLTTNP